MSLTPIAFQNGSPAVDIAVDADLRKLHPDMTNNLWSGETSYRTTIREAYNQTIFDLERGGFKASLIDSSAANIAWLKRVVSFQALIMIFRDFRGQAGDRWDMLIGDYQRQYDQAVATPVLDYDTDEDGSISTTETGTIGTVRLVR